MLPEHITIRSKVESRWTGVEAALESYPPQYGVFADDDHVDILAKLCKGRICEIGCGTGRCADVFGQQVYVGVDINLKAIELARMEHPGYDFRHIAWDDRYPEADTYLFHTCLMHVPPEELQGVLVRAKPRLVIFESMNAEYDKPHKLAWHRDPREYVYALNKAAFDVTHFEKHKTLYQPNKNGTPRVRCFMIAEAMG